MSIAFNIPASSLFDYFQNENKKKLVLKLDFVDDSENEEYVVLLMISWIVAGFKLSQLFE